VGDNVIGQVGLAAVLMFVGVVPVCRAQGKGDGGIVLRDGAPVYRGSTKELVEATLNRGDAVAGITTEGIFGNSYQFEEEDGRIHVLYFRSGTPVEGGTYYTAWMNPSDLARFTYDCGCDHESKPNCRPFSSRWMKFRWNTCFGESRDSKRAQLKLAGAGESAGADAPGAAAPGTSVPRQNAQVPTEKQLTNADVIALIKLELGDDLVISKIQQVPTEALDVSTDALIKLKGEGVSNAVLDAMIKRASQRK
jgi:hypothetical protein